MFNFIACLFWELGVESDQQNGASFRTPIVVIIVSFVLPPNIRHWQDLVSFVTQKKKAAKARSD